jgi:hypothetical protein
MRFESLASNNKELIKISTIGLVVMSVFVFLFIWRYVIRFFSKNSRIAIANDHLIIPGFLQMFPEIKIKFSDIDKVEYSEVGKGANYLIKVYSKNKTFPHTISWNNSMEVDEFNDFYSKLKVQLGIN